MKLLRIIVCVLAVVSIGAVIYFVINDDADIVPPVLNCSSDDIVISVSDTDEKLLSYVKAYDDKDGDISDRIIVENIAPYVSSGKADITYSVCDKSNNVAKLGITATYSDYKSPRFYLKKPLLLEYKARTFNVTDYVGVIDPFDKQSADNNLIAITDCSTVTVGDYPLELRVTNEKFDSVSLLLSITVSAKTNVEPIKLSKYLEYCKVGDTINYLTYVNRLDAEYVSVDSSKVDLKTPGTYEAVYYMEGKDATSFFVVCEDNTL